MPKRSRSHRAIKRQDKLRRNTCLRCPFRAPSGRCLDRTPRSGRCGDYVFYFLPGGQQSRRRWVRPKDPHTPAQLQNRSRMGAASRRYNARLSQAEQNACIAAAAQRQSRPRLGQSGPLTGQQYWVRQAYTPPAAATARNAKIPVQVPRPQKLTRPTWGTRRRRAGDALVTRRRAARWGRLSRRPFGTPVWKGRFTGRQECLPYVNGGSAGRLGAGFKPDPPKVCYVERAGVQTNARCRAFLGVLGGNG